MRAQPWRARECVSIRHMWDSCGALDDAIDPTAHDLLAVDFARADGAGTILAGGSATHNVM
jgi:hypothetical protein